MQRTKKELVWDSLVIPTRQLTRYIVYESNVGKLKALIRRLQKCLNQSCNWSLHAIGHYGDILVIKHSKRHDYNRVYNEPNYIIA